MTADRKKLVLIILGLVLLILTAGLIGGVVASTYPNWYQKLPFKNLVPASLRPTTLEVKNSKEVVRTVEESAVIEAVKKTSPAVVSIIAKTVNFDPYLGTVNDQQGIGTGFIVDSSGIVITNSHVVCDKTVSYDVLTADGKSYAVEKVDTDPANDIGILKIKANGLPTVSLGDSDPSSIKLGQKVIAIGNALGQFQNTITVGVISGVGRVVTASGGCATLGKETLNNVIQTDAAINPGNSGGPLLDLSGTAIGINFATADAQNIGFVIPINRVKPILDQYKKQGRIIKPFLGVRYRLIEPKEAVARGVPEGAFVSSVVAGSPADEAGVEAGDIITKVAGKKITLSNDLVSVLNDLTVGQSIEVEINRAGKTIKLKATLKEAS
ncbi:MAG: hypothetical protein A3F35_00220 [Candidatus Woykebacteria bacterium RIFCSPHIGHO2_12_FULL_45_10]|uniref:PDZ domain-containing protein n=1 Tax=Candidatus Woykebacteria bacterium RIFCSPHIGHO2_12_FULL_45_10 TaxID=1802603 RepID=A0A1G1WRC2_9BACT|nr:MAG: hypothetical protein A3F35_00220 [Candidatus Woykebacteria bacterium RIFCSPHIGHO2_12_FULL_45_10]